MNIEQFKKLVDEYIETGVVPEGLKQFKSRYIGQGGFGSLMLNGTR